MYQNSDYSGPANVDVTAAPTTPPPTFVPVESNQYLGCYIDDANRDISGGYVLVSSVAACQDICTGYHFFALQAGYACFCGNAYATQVHYAKVADSECAGVVGSSMGSGWRNAVYCNSDLINLIIRFIVTKIILALVILILL